VFWKREQVEAMLREQLLEAYGRVRDRAERSGADFRTAAQAVALERIAQAAALRGVYP
jgi:glutamate dehydrogenase (NAD(P)+)